MMIAHAQSAFIVFYDFLGLDVETFILLSMGSCLFFAVPNIMIIRGYSLARRFLLGLNVCYLLVGLSSFVFYFISKPGFIWLATATTLSASLVILILMSQKYKTMASFLYQRRKLFSNRNAAGSG